MLASLIEPNVNDIILASLIEPSICGWGRGFLFRRRLPLLLAGLLLLAAAWQIISCMCVWLSLWLI